MNQSIHDLVTATLSELGQPVPTNLIQTMMVRDGYFVGWRVRYNGGSAVLHKAGNAIEFFDEHGRLLKMVGTEDERGAAV
jgi:hypothetical protein